jgi:protein TonB
MTTIAFDRFNPSGRGAPRPSAGSRIRSSTGTSADTRAGAAPALTAPAGLAAPRRRGTLVLVALIAGVHLAGVAFLGGRHAPAERIPAPPISIELVAAAVEPPPPPVPVLRQPVPPKAVRPGAAAPRPAAAAPSPSLSTPLASEAAPATAAPDALPVAAAPASTPALAAPAAQEKVSEPRGYAGYLDNPPPAYPPSAQKRGLEGQVVLKVHVLASGQPDSVTVARSSGHAILDDAALKAVTQWTFEPARRGQSAIDGWVQVPLNFKI